MPTGGPTFFSKVREGFLEEALVKLRPISAVESPVSQRCLDSGSQACGARGISAVISTVVSKILKPPEPHQRKSHLDSNRGLLWIGG